MTSGSADPAGRPAFSAEPARRQRILDQKVEILYQHLPRGLLVNILVAAGLAQFLRASEAAAAVWWWALGVLVVTALRLVDRQSYLRRAAAEPGRTWYRRFLVGSTAQAVLWGVAGYVFLPFARPIEQLVLSTVFSAMVGGALIHLSAVWPVYLAYLGPTLLPACVQLIASDVAATQLVGVLGFMYAGAMAFASRATSRWIDTSLTSAAEQSALAVRLEAANTDLTQHQLLLEQRIAERTREVTEANQKLQAEILEKEAERRKTQLSEARFRELAELLPEVVYEIDLEGRLTFLNRRATELTGYSPEDLVALKMSPIDFFAPEDRSRLAANIRQVLNQERAATPNEYTLLRKDGSRFSVMAVSSPVIREGRVAGLRGVLVDTTRIKALEESLFHSQKMESMGRLAGGIAHDFNNVLSVILGYSDLLLGRSDSDPTIQAEILEIQKAAERATSLTRQLLAYSRRQVLQPQVVRLSEIVSNMERILRRLIGEDIELVTTLAADDPPVLVDPGQIEQIITNLAVNARDAMPRGGRLTIETRAVELDASMVAEFSAPVPGPHVMLRVEDTGVGIPRETLPKIFEPFFTTKVPGKGTGLGLATVYGIVMQSKGHIAVDSAPGQGTTFRVYLPVTRVVTPPLVPAPRGTEPGTRSGTILVVEDDEKVALLINRVLTSRGYRVLSARSGTEALRLSRTTSQPIDLLLTDVIMPGMNGRDLRDAVCAERPEIKVLFMSGYTDDVLGPHGILEDGIDFIAKPFSPKGFLQRITQILDGGDG